jgi:hypothetical protein
VGAGGGFDSAGDEVDAVAAIEAVGFVEVAEVSTAAWVFEGSAGSDSDPVAVSTDSSE